MFQILALKVAPEPQPWRHTLSLLTHSLWTRMASRVAHLPAITLLLSLGSSLLPLSQKAPQTNVIAKS